MRGLRITVVLAALLLVVSAHTMRAQHARTWDLGAYYPGGTWAELHGISDSGVAVGLGDVAGDQRMVGVPLFGRKEGNWFESGVSSGVVQELLPAISDTGVIAGTITGDNGNPEAYAWMPNHAGVHLGTLPGDFLSYAYAISRNGTFIVGQSMRQLTAAPYVIATAVVWTPRVERTGGRTTLAWEIHALPKGGLDTVGAVFPEVQLRLWGGWGVNDSGQVAGDAYQYDPETGNWWEIAVVWNPGDHGKGWRLQRLPMTAQAMAADFPYTEALAINDLGEIVGDVWGSAAAPALWKTNGPEGKAWKLTVLPSLDATPVWDLAEGINDRGDIVGYCYDSGGNPQATRWNAHAPHSPVQTLGFPGEWSAAFSVNNLGIAVGGYGIGDVERAFAVQFR
jgi:uncharacterized membrane protein